MHRRPLTLVTILLLAAMASGPAYAQPAASGTLLLAQICGTCSVGQHVTLPKAIRIAVAAHRAERFPRAPHEAFFAASFVPAQVGAEAVASGALMPEAPDAMAFLRDCGRANAPPLRA